MPMMLITLVGFMAASALATYAWFIHRNGLAGKLLVGMFVWLGVYGVALLAISLTSHEVLLGLNQEKRFCGFYLDCHLAASVTNVTKTKTLGAAENEQTAGGIFYIVRVRVASDARRATLFLDHPTATVIDEAGRIYDRALVAEVAWERTTGREVPFDQNVGPNYSYTYTKDLVFDLPTHLKGPRLLITKGSWLERWTELFLIGDEDSLFHKKTLFQMGY